MKEIKNVVQDLVEKAVQKPIERYIQGKDNGQPLSIEERMLKENKDYKKAERSTSRAWERAEKTIEHYEKKIEKAEEKAEKQTDKAWSEYDSKHRGRQARRSIDQEERRGGCPDGRAKHSLLKADEQMSRTARFSTSTTERDSKAIEERKKKNAENLRRINAYFDETDVKKADGTPERSGPTGPETNESEEVLDRPNYSDSEYEDVSVSPTSSEKDDEAIRERRRQAKENQERIDKYYEDVEKPKSRTKSENLHHQTAFYSANHDDLLGKRKSKLRDDTPGPARNRHRSGSRSSIVEKPKEGHKGALSSQKVKKHSKCDASTDSHERAHSQISSQNPWLSKISERIEDAKEEYRTVRDRRASDATHDRHKRSSDKRAGSQVWKPERAQSKIGKRIEEARETYHEIKQRRSSMTPEVPGGREHDQLSNKKRDHHQRRDSMTSQNPTQEPRDAYQRRESRAPEDLSHRLKDTHQRRDNRASQSSSSRQPQPEAESSVTEDPKGLDVYIPPRQNWKKPDRSGCPTQHADFQKDGTEAHKKREEEEELEKWKAQQQARLEKGNRRVPSVEHLDDDQISRWSWKEGPGEEKGLGHRLSGKGTRK